MANGQKTSPWVYVGVGCLAAVVVLVAVAAGVGYLGYRTAKRFGDEMKDPALRERKVKDILGAGLLPPGYYAVVGLSIPFIMDMAILSDRDPGDSQGRGFERRGFIYIKMLGIADQQRELREFFEGKRQDSRVLRQQSIRVRAKDVIKRGEFRQDDRRVLWVAERGGIEMRNAEVEGVTALFLVECRDDKRTRLGIWFGPDPDPSAPIATANFTGSPADEAEIRTFVDHFNLCRTQ